ncbi:MAG: hypothetical protein QOD81_3112 [Solirubrobacteraceae bacterium]|nr:hypothetical protein [Solirubrobacteraceae bacterium]
MSSVAGRPRTTTPAVAGGPPDLASYAACGRPTNALTGRRRTGTPARRSAPGTPSKFSPGSSSSPKSASRPSTTVSRPTPRTSLTLDSEVLQQRHALIGALVTEIARGTRAKTCATFVAVAPTARGVGHKSRLTADDARGASLQPLWHANPQWSSTRCLPVEHRGRRDRRRRRGRRVDRVGARAHQRAGRLHRPHGRVCRVRRQPEADHLPLAAGNHVVTFTSTWPGQAGQNGAFTQTVEGCPGPPAPPAVPPTPPSPPAASAPPASVVAPAPAPAAPVSRVKSAHARRSAAKPVKTCRSGRRHLHDSHGRRFTMCRTKPVRTTVRSPHFAG